MVNFDPVNPEKGFVESRIKDDLSSAEVFIPFFGIAFIFRIFGGF